MLFRVCASLLGMLLVFGSSQASEKTTIHFARDIRPILSNHCWACHGPDETTRAKGLRLDTKEGAFRALKKGGYAIVAGNAKSSVMLDRIHTSDPAKLMPPPESKRPLSDVQKQMLRDWIEQGADFASHWAFSTPKRPEIPKVKNATWVRNPIDAFILHRLEQAGLAPSPEANAETLLRRASLDLIGLQPSLEERDRFLRDAAPDAYEKLLDRLLASERHGERMAGPWLDKARYADTNGYNNDEERTMWPWREWVIRAFNRNLPYDQFIVEQLAGDLLPNPTPDQILATGFNRNHVLTTEGGIFEDEYRAEYVADRVHTTATVFLGLSMQCARCHEHKYDPISQKEYYQFFAYFHQIRDGIVPYSKAAAADPYIDYASPETRTRLADLQQRRVHALDRQKARQKEVDAAIAPWEATLKPADLNRSAEPGLAHHFKLDEGKGDSASDSIDPRRTGTAKKKLKWGTGKFGQAVQFESGAYLDFGSGVGGFESEERFAVSVWVKPTSAGTMAILSKMNESLAHRGYDLLLEDGRVVMHLVHRWPDDAIKVLSKERIAKDQWHHLAVSYDGSRKAKGLRIFIGGKAATLEVHTDKLQGSLQSGTSFHLGYRGASLPFQGWIDDVRMYRSEVSPDDIAKLHQGLSTQNLAELIAVPSAKRTQQQKDQIRQYYLEHVDPPLQALRKELADLDRAKAEAEKTIVPVMVMKDIAPPRETFVLKRGQYDQKGDKVSVGIPTALGPLPKDAPANRLGLAKWLVDPNHPLTARVAVNRIWAMYFGTGLVETVEDFGLQGDYPSHPELLDWLATEFVRTGWNLRKLHKLITSSATYRQDSKVLPIHQAKDPRNRLLARMPRFRLPAETIRDNALSVSGLLKNKIGGPSVKPYQPAGLWEDVSVERRYTYVPDKGEGLYRRSLYTYWRRTCPPPTMTLFDAPDRETCVIRRARTNTPLHALVVLNDPTYVEAARVLADHILITTKKDADRMDLLAKRVLGRPFNERESSAAFDYLGQERKRFSSRIDEAKKLVSVGEAARLKGNEEPELAAWTAMSHLVLNLDEFLTRP